MRIIESFPYLGPNRRSERTLIEQLIGFSDDEIELIKNQSVDLESRLVHLLRTNGLLEETDQFPLVPLSPEPMEWFSGLYAQLTLLLQQKCGHRVDEFQVQSVAGKSECVCLIEHEHADVGMSAARLAGMIMTLKLKNFRKVFAKLRDYSIERILPVETEAILDAARRRDIPAVKLDRTPFIVDPYPVIEAKDRVLPNGLLMLGQGCNQQVVDGFYCRGKSGTPPGQGSEDSGSLTVAPDLGADSPIIVNAAERLLDWLFPEGTPARIPLIAITGTNGKTTTTMMTNRMLQAAGFATGLVCTDGVFVDGRMVMDGDHTSRTGHLKALTSVEIEAGAFEASHRGMLDRGLAFDLCDVAVCTNVTSDHLGIYELDSTADIARIKRSLLETARHGVVLNADDEHCLGMLPYLSASKYCLVSMLQAQSSLAETSGDIFCFCVIEAIEDQDWIVIYDRDERYPVLAVADIPACYGGRAAFNVNNAQHAISACYLAGLDLALARPTLSGFVMNFETSPGRLNFFEGPSYAVIMDNAHNLDSFLQLARFTDQLNVGGRKILMMGMAGDRLDDDYRRTAAAVAGYYDHYICRATSSLRGRLPHEVPEFFRQGLIGAGVPEAQITVIEEIEQGIVHALALASEGDLLVANAAVAERTEMWTRIISAQI